MSWRLVDSDLLSPALSAAMDEAILLARHDGTVPDTLHLYRRSAPTVSLGHFQRVAETVDEEAATRQGVHLVRRSSGGSAIYTDEGQLILSLIADRAALPERPEKAFALVGQGLVRALSSFGLEAEHRPINDVLVRGRKISGAAQLRRWNVVLLSATLIVETDLGRLLEVLRKSKRTAAELTSLALLLGTTPPMPAIKAAVVTGLSKTLGVDFVPADLTAPEEATAHQLAEQIYGTREHTYRY